MKLPPLIQPPDGVTGEQMIRDGWERLELLLHRERLMRAHVYGRHTSPVEQCELCAREIALLCAGWYEPHAEISRGFR